MSKTKSLLSFALAATMLFSTVFVGVNAEDATPKTGTLKIGTATVEVGEPTATVDFTLTFTEAVEAPHELATIVAMNENDEALTITDVVLGDVTYSDGYVDENLDVNDPELEVPALRIKTDGINKTAGKVLFESGVDSAVKASVINFTVTFDTTNATVGTYTVSAVIDSTDLDESEIVVTAEDGAIVVAEPHVCSAGEATDNGDGTHDIACAGCDKLFADNEACKYVDGACSVCGAADPDYVPEVHEHSWGEWIVDTDATIVAKGSKHRECACGETETADIEVTVPEIDEAITFGTTVSFDHETSRVGIGYGYTSNSDFRMKIVRPANNGTRKLWNVVVVNGKEYLFKLDNVYSSGAELGVVGLSLEELCSATVEMSIRVCWQDNYGVEHNFDTNKYTVDCAAVLADARANMGDDESTNAFFALVDVWSGLTTEDIENVGTEAIAFDDFVDGFEYTEAVTFNPAGCGVNVPYGYSSDSAFRAGYRAANNGTRKAYTVITVNGVEYVFEAAGVYASGATLGVVGLSTGDYQSSVSFSLRYTWTDESGDHVYNTNKANITVHNYLVNSESDFAVAYKAYIATLG